VGNVAGKTFVPSGQWPPMPMTETDPVTSVNWCDAYSYCAWAGKRLCGQIGGGPLSQGSADDTGASQWFYACSQQGQRAYPYGHNYVPTACNGNAANVAPVATFPQCVGGYPGIFDMSGNVREWEDSCSGAAGMGDMCNERGGSVNDQGAGLACATSDFAARTDSNVHLGFRCCAP
jgi:formylglycine-generating enzyme required for sulfatase activity